MNALEQNDRFMAMIRLPQYISDQKLTEYNLGTSKEEIYSAVASLTYKKNYYNIECYVILDTVKRNAVGTIISDVGYVVALVGPCDFDRKSIVSINNLKLIDMVRKLPEW